MKTTPILTTPRLRLRPMTKEDLATTFAYAGTPENTEYMLFLPYRDLSEAEAELQKMEEKMEQTPQRDYFFAIERNNTHIGEISLEMNPAMTEAELGWILHRDHWGNGYMTEAALAVRDFAKNIPTLRILYAHCDSRNHASSAIMKRLGMTQTAKGIRRNRGSQQDSEELTFTLRLQS